MADENAPAQAEKKGLLAAVEAALADDADADEAAAVAAAIGAHMRDQELAAAAADGDSSPNWADGKWTFASKVARKRRRSDRGPGRPLDGGGSHGSNVNQPPRCA